MHPRIPSTPHRWRAFSAALAAALLAMGCGGGDGGVVGSGGTGAPQSFSQGPISGFGSIVVNGVHFDDSAATVLDEDGNVLSGATSLRLGSTVDLDAGAIAANAAAASTIHVRTDLVGPVTSAYDAATGRIFVLGLPVAINATTALDAFAAGAASIPVGSVVAVSSLVNASAGGWVATRIDPDPSATRYAVRGALASAGSSGGRITIAGQVFDLGGVSPPSGLAAGQIVRVELSTTPNSSGQFVVTSFGQGVVTPPNGRQGEVRGVVSGTTDARHFTVAGLAVDASTAAFKPANASVALASLVTVEGNMVAGVLVATEVDVITGNDDDGGSGGGGGGSGGGDQFEIDGAILGAIDLAHQTFTLRGPTTINYASASFSSGSAADLATGVRVEVKGNLSADGTQVIATQVKFDH